MYRDVVSFVNTYSLWFGCDESCISQAPFKNLFIHLRLNQVLSLDFVGPFLAYNLKVRSHQKNLLCKMYGNLRLSDFISKIKFLIKNIFVNLKKYKLKFAVRDYWV